MTDIKDAADVISAVKKEIAELRAKRDEAEHTVAYCTREIIKQSHKLDRIYDDFRPGEWKQLVRK